MLTPSDGIDLISEIHPYMMVLRYGVGKRWLVLKVPVIGAYHNIVAWMN